MISEYRILPENEKYRDGFIKEIVDVRKHQLEVEGFDDDEFEAIFQHLCVSWCWLGDHLLSLFQTVFSEVFCSVYSYSGAIQYCTLRLNHII